MNGMEVVLLVIGGLIFVASFMLPEKKEKAAAQTKELAREEVSRIVKQEMDQVRSHVDEVVEEAVGYAMEKTERSLERVSNEKIMAVNEYSDTVLAEIHKNHEEAMFLYDMLNSKHTNIKNTVSEVNRTMKEAEEKVSVMQTQIANEQLIQETGRESVKNDTLEMEDAVDVSIDLPTEEDRHEYNNNDKIRELYGQGKDTIEIAKALGLGVGEVKLVIDLFCRS